MRPKSIEIIDAEPRISGDGRPVSAIVHACHERTIDVALAEFGVPGLDRASLEPILTYCAELACEADWASCPGCKRRTEVQGIASLDDYIARHREIIVGDGRVRLTGQGEDTVTTPALEALAKTWSGENYWFWARRVLRKHRHGIRRAHIQGSAVADSGKTPAVILMEPQLPDNIGMVARAMANFGLDELRLVAPRDGWPQEKARIAASGANYVIDDAAAYPTLDAAVGDLTWVAATTARQRDLRKPVLTPEQAVDEAFTRIARGERCGFLFGREGYVVVTPEYRLTGEAAWPAQIHDTKAALRWMHANAETLGVDPKRIAVMGNSAGGHLALMLAGTQNNPKFEGESGSAGARSDVAAVVNLYGITSIEPDGDFLQENFVELFGAGAGRELHREASPVEYVNASFPPTVILQSREDPLVPIAQNLLLWEKLQAAGVTVEMHVFDRVGHALDATRDLGRHTAAIGVLFLQRFMGAPEEASK